MKLLVTGGLGFIGSCFIRLHLQSHPEDEIINLGRLTFPTNKMADKALQSIKNQKLFVGDMRDKELMINLTKGVDEIVHFAAKTDVDKSIEDVHPFVTSNVLGTLNLLEAARINGVSRFHSVSTDEVFGSLEPGAPRFSEESRYNPRNPFAVSIAAANFYVRLYHETYGLGTTISYCSNNFGPYQDPNRLIPKAILNFVADKKMPVYGDGKNIRDWIYVEDHCSAIDLILDRANPGEEYCISSSNELENIALLRKILALLGKSEDLITFVTDRPGHDRRSSLNPTSLVTRLGWRPSHEFGAALAETVEWYVKNQIWLRSD